MERELQEKVMQQLAPKKQTNRQRPIALPPPPMNEAADDKENNSQAQVTITHPSNSISLTQKTSLPK